MTSQLVDVSNYLTQFRADRGEEAWREEIRRLARQGIATSPKHEAFWKGFTGAFDWIDWEQLKREAVSVPASSQTPVEDQHKLINELLKSQFPQLKNQAQYNAVLNLFEAVRLTLNSIFEGNQAKTAEGRKAVDMAFELALKVSDITQKLDEVPESATSPAANEFKTPPAQFTEHDVQRELLTELQDINYLDDLTIWYARSKDRRDKIVSQFLRNTLMDAVRAKKLDLL